MAKRLYKKNTTASKGSITQTAETEEEQQVRSEQSLGTKGQMVEESTVTPEPIVTSSSSVPRPLALGDLPLDVIVPNPFQARKNFDLDRLQDLASAMREHGIITRIRVRKAPISEDEERYELVYGERRWRAAKLAGLTHYPVEISPYNDDEMVEIGLLENVQREDLTPLEEAEMYQRLLDQVDEQGQARYSIRKLAERIGKDKSYIEMRLAVLRAPEDVQRLVEERPETPLRTAYEIGKVVDPEVRETILTDVREGKLQKVEQVKARVREAIGQPPKEKTVVASTTFVAPVSAETPKQPAATITDQRVEQDEQLQEGSAVSDESSLDSTHALSTPLSVLQGDDVIMERLAQVRTVLTQFQSYKHMMGIDRPTEAERRVIGEIGGLVDLFLERD